MDTRDFKGLNILLTGSTGGIGSIVLAHLLEAGARVFATARRPKPMQEIRSRLAPEHKDRIEFYPADLSKPTQVPKLVERANNWFEGRLDVLINNAGIGYHCPVDNVDPREAVEVMNVNAVSPMILIGLSLPLLRQAQHPKVINITSFLGTKALPLTATYTASKHALTGYSKVLRVETADRGLSVTLIEPGAIATTFSARTHDPTAIARMSARRFTKLSPDEVCRWVLTVIESPPFSCPEVIRIAPISQAI